MFSHLGTLSMCIQLDKMGMTNNTLHPRFFLVTSRYSLAMLPSFGGLSWAGTSNEDDGHIESVRQTPGMAEADGAKERGEERRWNLEI